MFYAIENITQEITIKHVWLRGLEEYPVLLFFRSFVRLFGRGSSEQMHVLIEWIQCLS